METKTKKLAWKVSVPIVAVLLVIGIIIYTGGFGNFLKLLGIKASELQTIELASAGQMLGNDSSTWLSGIPTLEGTVVENTFEGIPADPDGDGFVMALYSAEDTSSSHSYTSPVINLGAPAPTLSSIAVQSYEAEGASLAYSYRTAATASELDSASFVPMELTQNQGGSDIVTRAAALESLVQQYVQVQVSFDEAEATSRSAVYGWTIQYNQNIAEEPMVDENPDTIVNPPVDETPNGSDDTEDEEVTDEEALEEVERRVQVTFDFTNAANLPDEMDITLVTASNILGTKEVVKLTGLLTEQVAPLFNLPELLDGDYYTAVIEAEGYKTVVIPFLARATYPEILQVPSFVSSNQLVNFDLNNDGVINSLDLTLLIDQMGKVSVTS